MPRPMPLLISRPWLLARVLQVDFSYITLQRQRQIGEWVRIPNLRELRELHGLTQKELADVSGVSLRSVAGYEGGAHVRPNTARKLAQALNVEVADLVGSGADPKAEAPPWQQPPLNGLLAEERRTPTFAELHAIETLKGHRDHLEEFLETAKRKHIDPVFWVIEADHTIDMAAVGLAFPQPEPPWPLLPPPAARLVKPAYEVLDGLRDAEAEREVKKRREAIRMMKEAVALKRGCATTLSPDPTPFPTKGGCNVILQDNHPERIDD